MVNLLTKTEPINGYIDGFEYNPLAEIRHVRNWDIGNFNSKPEPNKKKLFAHDFHDMISIFQDICFALFQSQYIYCTYFPATTLDKTLYRYRHNSIYQDTVRQLYKKGFRPSSKKRYSILLDHPFEIDIFNEEELLRSLIKCTMYDIGSFCFINDLETIAITSTHHMAYYLYFKETFIYDILINKISPRYPQINIQKMENILK